MVFGMPRECLRNSGPPGPSASPGRAVPDRSSPVSNALAGLRWSPRRSLGWRCGTRRFSVFEWRVLHFGVGICLSALLDGGDVSSRPARAVREWLRADCRCEVARGGFLVALLFVSFRIARLERWSFSTATGYVALLTTLVGLTLGLAVFDRTSSAAALTLDLDEEFLPTQRLNLAG